MKDPDMTYTLANGIQIPAIGLGTWQTPDGEIAANAVKDAIEVGYRHIDTAQAYGNERSVGEGIRRSGIKREELFVTTKLTNDNHTYELMMSSFEQSLKDLGLDYVDLFLIHWPNPLNFRDRWQKANAEVWKAMEELYKDGKIRAVGVSNFKQHHLEALFDTAEIMPMVDQIRLCPGCTQDELVRFARKHGMILEAYSPLGTGKVFDSVEVHGIADKYGKSIAQVCLRWSLQMGFLPIPKSVNKERMAANKDVFDFELSDDDMEYLTGLHEIAGGAPNPDNMPF
ncbi:Aldo/keto reductase [Ruminococcaceae bacterium YRB3002]|nr:Aldo/keto reductase [Ruminococcaceae bacterium YRB3002]